MNSLHCTSPQVVCRRIACHFLAFTVQRTSRVLGAGRQSKHLARQCAIANGRSAELRNVMFCEPTLVDLFCIGSTQGLLLYFTATAIMSSPKGFNVGGHRYDTVHACYTLCTVCPIDQILTIHQSNIFAKPWPAFMWVAIPKYKDSRPCKGAAHPAPRQIWDQVTILRTCQKKLGTEFMNICFPYVPTL